MASITISLSPQHPVLSTMSMSGNKLLANRITPKLYREHKQARSVPPSDVCSQMQPKPRVLREVAEKGNKYGIKTTRISEMFAKIDKPSMSSSYDTAWLAMVPSKGCKEKPLFPECVEWIMENQRPDGSWSVDPYHPLLLKDALSSTLACLLALHKWRVGQDMVKRGLKFIEQNCWAANDERQLTPIGFDIIFPGLVEQAIQNGITLPLDPSLVSELLEERENKVERDHAGYVLEGFDGESNWKDAMKRQHQNGSISNSPSSTAAALLHKYDKKCHEYLDSILRLNNNEVPPIYPVTIYNNLHTIENLQQLGIERLFKVQTETILDNIYRCWLQKDEEIFSNANCCALGFRLLRFNGYDVFSDDLGEFAEENQFFGSTSIEYHNTRTILELYKASQYAIYSDEPVLDKIKDWTSSFLKQELVNGNILNKKLQEEVGHALRYTHDTLARLENKRSIELLDIDNMELLKTLNRSPYMDNRDYLVLAMKDYNLCQKIYQQELRDLERWVKDSKLDQLQYARQKLNYCYFSNAAVAVPPELATVRISMTKNCVMATVIDDFFDCGGSWEELGNFMELFKRLEDNKSTENYSSKQVEILFSALKSMIDDLGPEASQLQGRNVTPHLISIWHDLLKSMMKEAKWARENITPSMEEYMENAYVSFAMGPITLIPLYVVGPKLSEEMVSSSEYSSLFKKVSICGRLLNDLASVKREGEQGKLNSVSLRSLDAQGTKTEDQVITETKKLVEDYRRDILRTVLQKRGSLIPRACKDLFLGMSHMIQYFYKEKDGYSCSTAKVQDFEAVLWDPIINPYVLASSTKDFD